MGREVLNELKKGYQAFAKCLGDYESISTTDLANGYCDADEALKATDDPHEKKEYEIKRSQYYSALVLRYWYKIFEYEKSCASMRLEIEDYVSWIDESFKWAFRYRVWRDPNDDCYYKKDPNGPDKVFNRCFFSTRGRNYQHTNKEVRKVNWMSSSLDALEESVGDHTTVFGAEEDTPYARELVQSLLEKSKIMEALVVDSAIRCDIWDENKEKAYRDAIVLDEEGKPVYDENGDVIYTKEEYYKITKQLNIKKLVKHIKYLSADFANCFVKYYDLDSETKEKFMAKVKSISPNGLSKVVQRTLYNLRQNRDVLNLLENS